MRSGKRHRPALSFSLLLYRRSERFLAHDAFALSHIDELVGLNVFQCVHHSTRPTNFENVDFGSVSDAEMDPQVILREVSAAAADFIDLLVRLGLTRHLNDAAHPCSDSAAVGFDTYRADLNPVILQLRVTTEQLRKLVDAVHHDINVAVVVEIPESGAARGRGLGDARPDVKRNVFEL